jgi:excisionase family DNA binding protein
MGHPSDLDFVIDAGSTLDKLPPILVAPEVAELMRMNTNTVYEAAARDEIPGAVRVGRSLRFVRDVVLRWLFGKEAARVREGRTR